MNSFECERQFWRVNTQFESEEFCFENNLKAIAKFAFGLILLQTILYKQTVKDSMEFSDIKMVLFATIPLVNLMKMEILLRKHSSQQTSEAVFLGAEHQLERLWGHTR